MSQLIRQEPLTGQQDVAVGLESWSSFHGHYHQHVEQNCEGTSDAVKDDSEDITNLQWDIFYVAFCVGHLRRSVCKIYSEEIGHVELKDF